MEAPDMPSMPAASIVGFFSFSPAMSTASRLTIFMKQTPLPSSVMVISCYISIGSQFAVDYVCFLRLFLRLAEKLVRLNNAF
jgi:hypothetical protein